jgi:dTMP kinase
MEHSSSHTKKPRSLRGAFITFEGTEGSGKSTQCQRLARSLRAQGYQVRQTREPGGTPLAETIRTLLLTSSNSKRPTESITPVCESMLIFAARAQHMAHVIQPALNKGMVVLCDRFFDSTLAYQGHARGLKKTFLYEVQQFVSNGLQPHLTFFLDLPIQDGLARRQQSNKQDRLDKESLSFHQRVRRGFLALAKQDPKRIQKVDARQSPQALASHIATLAEQLIRNTKSLRLIRSSQKQ